MTNKFRKILRSWFVVNPKQTLKSSYISTSSTPKTPEKSQASSPLFITPKSLATFPGASLAINILWNLVRVLNEDIAKMSVVPIFLAFLVGGLIYYASIDDSMSKKDKIVAGGIAIINSIWLGLNALGIDSMFTQNGT